MRLPTLEHFGACPECHECTGYLNVRKAHWFYCETHKTAWCVGTNLFSSWQYETDADWQANAEKLSDYREVEPSSWGWSDVPLRASDLRVWFRDWRNYFAWTLYGHRLFKRRMKRQEKHRPADGFDDVPF